MKYEAPIVAADIHARETFGFSSFSSKVIMNCLPYQPISSPKEGVPQQ